MHTKYIPFIPETVKARFSGYHITLNGPKEDTERAANLLLNYGIATGEDSREETAVGFIRITVTFYRKNLAGAIRAIAETGFVGKGSRPAVRRKHDGRKNKSILDFQCELEGYRAARIPQIKQALSAVREDIGERAELVEGRAGRGLNELVEVV